MADLMSIGTQMLGRRHVLPSVCSTLTELMVEGTFPMGTYLVTVHHPISTDGGDLAKALYGSFIPVPSSDLFPAIDTNEYQPTKAPGAVITVKTGKIVLSPGRRRIQLKVTSKGDRPIQVRVLAILQWMCFLIYASRLAHTIISSKQILYLSLTESKLMVTP